MPQTNSFVGSPTPRCFAILLLCAVPAGSIAAATPNVLILYADDLGYGDLGVYNRQSFIPTPNLDRLAGEGIQFLDGHSSSSICSTSRYALLTGRYHWRKMHHIVGVLGGSAFDSERLTLPEMMQQKGYTTACIGKWHLGWDWPAIRKPDAQPRGEDRRKYWPPEAFDWSQSIPDGPLAHGFNHYFGDTVINFPPYCWIRDDQVVEPPDTVLDTTRFKKIKEGNWECRPGPMRSDWDPYQNLPTLATEGVDFIRRQQAASEPFCLYFAFPSPHAPIIPNDRFDGRSQAGPYGDFVVETDDVVGQLLGALAETGQAESTIVIFTSDNGPERYAYARDEKYGHWSATPLRGLKRDLYEGGHRVPFMIRWPGVVEAGRVSQALVSQVDLMATLAAIVDFELPDGAAEDSQSLLSHLEGETEQVRTTLIHCVHTKEWAIRDGDWVLIDASDGYVSTRNEPWEARHGYSTSDELPVELYNLADDPGQRHNVASGHPERVEELQSRLQRR